MARIAVPTKEQAPVKSQPILENYDKVLGTIPNFFAMISQSPDALKAIADMHATLGKSLGHKTRERIHVMTAEVNGCSYCLTAHTYLGAKLNGMTAEDLELNRSGHSTDPKADAALTFAYKVAKSRGHIADADFEAVRAAGFSDAEIVDIVAETAFSFITNLFNNTFATERDALFQPHLTVRTSETVPFAKYVSTAQ
jgi:uncharacterized peroxidase-related enzyme